MQPSAFSHPSQECDIIMKGGITSGVVYPLAVVELAKTYRLRNIGGTSAGAIAAALAAAAEHGRDDPRAGGFPKLAELPGFLAGHLTGLFQPAFDTRPKGGIYLVPGKQQRADRRVLARCDLLADAYALLQNQVAPIRGT